MFQFDATRGHYGCCSVDRRPAPSFINNVRGSLIVKDDPSTSQSGSGCGSNKASEWKDTSLISFHHMLERFIKSKENRLYLPSNLTAQQKNYLLALVQCLNLKLKQGGGNEAACVLKTPKVIPFVRLLVLGHESKLRIQHYLKSVRGKNGIVKEQPDRLKPFTFRPGVAVLTGGAPRVPRKIRSNDYQAHRESVPIYKFRQQILDLIHTNAYSLIKGDAGVGKSTQIPQYILEDAEEARTPVRILVCLPSRANVIAICDRVAAERGEPVGHTVGYQVHLESCSSPVESLLNFVTGPVLLRALATPGCHLLDNTTHIILDEIHTRNRYQDFIMNCLRDVVSTKRHLKVIFLGQDLNVGFIPDYFGGPTVCPELKIPGQSHQVTTYYMEDILRFSWSTNNGCNIHYMFTGAGGNQTSEEQKQENARGVYNVDALIERVWKRVDAENNLYDFVHLVRDDEINVNYPHSITRITMLMAVCVAGLTESVQTLLDLDADIYLRSKNGYTAMDWASYFSRFDIVHMLNQHGKTLAEAPEHTPDPRDCFLRDYYRRTESDSVDLVLIVRLIHMIHANDSSNGTILIFLPTYEDLTLLKDYLCQSFKSDPGWDANENTFVIHFLHAHIQTADQRAAFEKLRPNHRKIILAANVSENAITLHDIVYVIDCGKSKTCSNEHSWISKAEADLRKSRTGRSGPGTCFRLYTSAIYEEEMSEFVVAEVLRRSLLSLCLQSRSLLRNDVQIQEFLEFLPTPPKPKDAVEAVKTLKLIGALEEDEQLSDLGVHMLDYDIEPQWAKALLYSVVFKCMDPVLTIAAYVSYGDAFIPQSHPHYRSVANLRKLELSGGTMSDHNAILKAFQNWESLKASRNGNVEDFCAKNYLSSPTFDVVYGIRSRLLGQIRASGFIRSKGPNDVRDLNLNSNNWVVVKAVLAAALYPNIGVANRITRTVLSRSPSEEIKLHSSSVLAIQDFNWIQELPSDWIVFNSKDDIDGKLTIRGCTVVSAPTVALFAGDLSAYPQVFELSPPPLIQGTGLTFTAEDRSKCAPQLNKVCLALDDWIHMFSFDPSIKDILSLREKLKTLVQNRLRRPEAFTTKAESELLQTFVHVLSVEDARVGLKQSKVGQWPKLVAGNLLSTPRTGFEVSH